MITGFYFGEDMAYIYALVDPITQEIKYIGKTKKKVRDRLREHIGEAKSYRNKNYRVDWIRSLLSENLVPNIFILEKCKDWQNAEKFWIKLCKNQGCKLTNLTEGGDGVVNGLPEIGRKISLKNKGRVGPNKGKKFSDEWKRNLSLSRLKTHRREITRNRISEANKGKVLKNKSLKQKTSPN